MTSCELSSARSLCLTWFLSPCLFKEKERELCVRERLAEDKLARAESLLKNYSLLKEQKVLCLASGPGMRIGSANRSPTEEGRAPVLVPWGFGSPFN